MKLKHLLTVLICFTCSFAIFAQLPADSLKVTVQGPLNFGVSAACDMTPATKYYLHSGVGMAANPWENVTGNWGMDDGVGEMSPTGTTDEWSITVHVANYYGVDPDSVTDMGMVVRSQDGTAEGKDSTCQDIFGRDLTTMTPVAEGFTGNPFPHVTFEWIAATGIRSINKNVTSLTAYPNPVVDKATIAYSLVKKSNNVTIKVYNALGSEVATLLADQSKPAGKYTVAWDCNDLNGDAVDSGIYFYVIKADDSVLSNRMMVVR